MKEKLLKLSAFGYWANRHIFEAVQRENIEDEKLFFWAAHILNADQLWMDRIAGIPISVKPFEKRASDTLLTGLEKNHLRFDQLLESHTDASLKQIIAYQSTEGDAFENELSDILFHLINHATHHRSQMAARIRDLGFQPPATDYIFYLR